MFPHCAYYNCLRLTTADKYPQHMHLIQKGFSNTPTVSEVNVLQYNHTRFTRAIFGVIAVRLAFTYLGNAWDNNAISTQQRYILF